MQINAITTLTDWTSLGGAWSEQGVARILSYCKSAGMKKVYWRIFNGGSAKYPSNVASRWKGAGPSIDKLKSLGTEGTYAWRPYVNFETWNCVTDAVRIGHDLGLEVHGWYSVFEDDHGGGSGSSFVAEHPEYIQMDINGNKMQKVVDFFFDGVREYKQQIIDEIAEFGLDGMLLDYARHNAVPSGDTKTGIHRLGYNPEIVAAFKEKTGRDAFTIDPADAEWLAFKAEPHTQFITETREKMIAKNPNFKMSMMLWPVDYLTWAAIDVPTLTERGVIDLLTAMSVKYTFHPREAKAQYDILKQQCKSDKVQIAPGICAYNGIFTRAFENYVEAAEQAGAKELILYEGDHIVDDDILFPLGNVNFGIPNYKRTLEATKITGEPDWDSIPEYSGFILMRGKENTFTPTNDTRFKIAYNDENLYVKFFCADQNPEHLLPVPRDENHYYLKELNARNYWDGWDSFNLLLDVHNSNADFCHFKVEPDGLLKQQTRVDGEWQGQWDAAVEVTEGGWGGVMTIPLATLDVENPKEMGINLVRAEQPPVKEANWMYGNEVSGWFRTWYHTMLPQEFGKIEFK